MKIFFAIDGSQSSLHAIRQVGQLLSPKDTAALYFALPEVIVHHSSTVEENQSVALNAISESVIREARQFLPDSLAEKATLITTRDAPRKGILLEANSWGAEMIVVGARGISKLDKLFLGSVSQSIVRNSTLPVLVSRPLSEHHKAWPLRVLYAYDGSESCRAALAAAEQLTFPEQTEFFAMTVVDSLPAELPDFILHRRTADLERMIGKWRRDMEGDKRLAEDQLTALIASRSAPFHRAKVIVAEGSPAEQLLGVIESRLIDLVIIGSHGNGLLKRTFLGSTSEKVLSHSFCSVLIARASASKHDLQKD